VRALMMWPTRCPASHRGRQVHAGRGNGSGLATFEELIAAGAAPRRWKRPAPRQGRKVRRITRQKAPSGTSVGVVEAVGMIAREDSLRQIRMLATTIHKPPIRKAAKLTGV
jgi:hypothetical protein